MTWECPTCDRAYPDNGIEIKDEDRGSYCYVCAIHPNDIRELVNRWQDMKTRGLYGRYANECTIGVCADILEEVLEE